MPASGLRSKNSLARLDPKATPTDLFSTPFNADRCPLFPAVPRPDYPSNRLGGITVDPSRRVFLNCQQGDT